MEAGVVVVGAAGGAAFGAFIIGVGLATCQLGAEEVDGDVCDCECFRMSAEE